MDVGARVKYVGDNDNEHWQARKGETGTVTDAGLEDCDGDRLVGVKFDGEWTTVYAWVKNLEIVTV